MIQYALRVLSFIQAMVTEPLTVGNSFRMDTRLLTLSSYPDSYYWLGCPIV
jgi:hypothetical protein